MHLMKVALLMQCVFVCSEQGRVLVISPFGVRSLHSTMNAIAMKLAERGHTITTYSIIKCHNHPNVTQIIVADEYPWDSYETPDVLTSSHYTHQMRIYEAGLAAAVLLFKNQNFIDLLQSTSKKFDIILNYDLPICFSLASIEYLLNIPGVTIINHGGAVQTSWLLGEHFNPAYNPEMKTSYNEVMNAKERFYNVYVTLVTLFVTYNFALPQHERFLDSYMETLPKLKDRPPLTELIANKKLAIVQSHAAVDYMHQYSDRIKLIAGLNINNNRTLPENIEKFMNNANDGVILVSWGTLVQGKQVERCERVLLRVFSKLKQKIIWKYNVKSPIPSSNLTNNLLIVDWLPQQAILAHKHLLLLMTHGGMNSMIEAAHYGVPTVVTPFFMDQFRNAKISSTKGVGITLHYDNFTDESVYEVINEVVTNKKYKESAMKRSEMFQDRMLDQIDEAVYWIEYTMKYGEMMPSSVAAKMPIYVQLLFDIIAIILITMATIYMIIFLAVKKLSTVVVCLIKDHSISVKQKFK